MRLFFKWTKKRPETSGLFNLLIHIKSFLELFDPSASFIEFLSSGIKRMGIRAHLNFYNGIRLAVFPLGRLIGSFS